MKRQRENNNGNGNNNELPQPKFKIQKTAVSSSQHKQLKVEDALAYLEQVKQKFKDKPQVYNRFLDIMKEFKSQTIDTPGVISRVSELFKGNTALILGFNTFLPPGYKIEIDEETNEPITSMPGSSTPVAAANAATASQQQAQTSKSTLPAADASSAEADKKKSNTATTGAADAGPGKQSIDFDQAINYVTKIKMRFVDQPDTYKAFLDILHTYQKEQTTIKKVYEQVSQLFKDHTDLLNEFAQFLPVPVNQPTPKKQKPSSGASAGSASKVKTAKTKPADTSNRRKRSSARRADELIKRQSGGDEQQADGNDANGGLASGNNYYDEFDRNNKEFAGKANVSKYGPSYRLLPRNYPQPICSERSDLCNEVLNDELVSVPAGSEEGRDVHKKTQYDETLFQCEDDRCELDIVIEQNVSTIRFLQPYAEKLKKDEKINFQFDLLRDIHRASIARIYAEKGNEVLEGLRKVPTVAIPIVLKRLKQKDDEWQVARKELNKFWREIYEKNFERAQENQAQTFKQFDKKKLNSRSILNDLQLRSDYNKQLIVQFKDGNTHQDIYTLLCKSQEKPEDMEAFHNFFKTFVIPYFGLIKGDVSDKCDLYKLLSTQEESKPATQQEKQSEQQQEPFLPIVEQSLGKPPNKQLFLGNTPLVLFIRYYQMIYHRLTKAKELALKTASRKYSANVEVVKKHEALQEGRVGSSAAGSADTMVEDSESAPDNKEIGVANYHVFLRFAEQFIEGTLESNKFEDEARKLLGYEAYITYTLDKLVSHMHKQLATVLSDEQCEQLLDAYSYERKRVNRLLDKSYVAHVSRILSKDVIFGSKYYPETKRMAVYIYNPPEIDPEREKAERRAIKYVEKFVNTPSSTASVNQQAPQTTQRKSKQFLARNKKRINEQKVFDNIIVRNGLECKLCIATMKLFYVEDTEDFFRRTHTASETKKRQETLANKKKQQATKFAAWHQKRFEYVSSLPAETAEAQPPQPEAMQQ